MTKSKEIRVRIAPSPTGNLHMGTARTAIFNWLYAKNLGGKFILRIEDTDLERSDKKFEKDILENLKWLGIAWDEGPFRQSERTKSYEKPVTKLLKEGLAYYCFCSKDHLEAQRQAMLAQGMAPKYSGKCRSLAVDVVKTKLKNKESHIIRLKIPEKEITFRDMIRGDITFNTGLIGDFSIAKDVKVPLYNFAVVIDDEDMQISHVIRGEDHIANTPKQILIQEALGFSRPHYAHLPLILNPDRSKMSKRFSATTVQEYKDSGYLPEVLFNFISLLGWHPVEDKEIMTVNQLIKEFEIGRVQKAGAIFNVEKLDWLNSQYVRNLADKEIAGKLDIKPTEGNLKIIAQTKERMKKLSDFKEMAGFFFELPEYKTEMLNWKKTEKDLTLANLKKSEKILSDVKTGDFNKSELEKKLMPIAEAEGRGEILWPLRSALSGLEASPGPFEIMDVLGKKESLRRIKVALQKLETSG